MRRFDAITDLAEVYPLDVFPDTIGIRADGREQLLAYAAATFNGFGPRNDLYRATTAAAQDATAWVAEACRREHLAPGGWGMAVYEASDRGECSEEEASRLVRSFLSAGIDTTINAIGNMILAFAEAPDQWAKLRDKPHLVRNAVEEVLRWDSTVQIFFRTTACAVEIAGASLPEGAKVLLFLAAANRDPRRWSNPESFDIERRASGHVGFGFGIHQCLGQMVARLEIELVLLSLISRVRCIRCVGQPLRRMNNTLHALASLPVEVEES
jgi:4-methoxybenzoate monooxygenase (O-demethylating)